MKFKDVIRLITGAVFIYSGILKLISIDNFEIYVYGLNLLSLNFSFFAARLVIGVELFLGSTMMVSRQNWPAYLSSLMLIGFSAFITYLIVSQTQEHCHCFGDAIQLNHPQSLLKNIVLIALIFFAYRNTEVKKYRFILPINILLLAVSVSLPFIISPPDNLRHSQYAEKISYSELYLSEFLNENPDTEEIKLTAFFGAKCRFCKLAAKKVNVTLQKTGFSNVEYVFWGKEESINSFYAENYLDPTPYITMEGGRFLRITDGNMPIIIISKGDSVLLKSGYRDFSEKDFISILSSN